MATTAEMQEELASLEKARADFIAGKMGVSVAFDGHSVTLNRTTLGTIMRRIRELQRALGMRTSSRSFGVQF